MPNQIDELITNPKVAKRLGVTTRTVFRWTTQPELNFQKPCLVNNRRYFSLAEIEAWQASRKSGAAPAPAVSNAPAIADPVPSRKTDRRLIDRLNASEVEAP